VTVPASTRGVSAIQSDCAPETSQSRASTVSGKATIAAPQATASSVADSPSDAGARRTQWVAGSVQTPAHAPSSKWSKTFGCPLRPAYTAVQPPPSVVMSQ